MAKKKKNDDLESFFNTEFEKRYNSENKKSSKINKKQKEDKKYFDKEKIGTIHDVKNELILFFQEEDKKRKSDGKIFVKNRGKHKQKKSILEKIKRVSRPPSELDIWDDRKQSLEAFNRIVTKKKQELQYEVRKGKNVAKNMRILNGKQKIELSVGKNIRDVLSESIHAFKLKEFYLKTSKYDFVNNKIKFFEGKDDFYFILDTGFKKHNIPYKELKKDSLLSEKNLILKFIEIYQKDVEESFNKDEKKYKGKELKQRSKVYDKIFNVIDHNKNIATMDGYKTKIIKYKKNTKTKKREIVRLDGEYPMMFRMEDNIMYIYIP